MKHIALAATLATGLLAAGLFAAPALADSWTLNTDESHLAFASVKNDYVGEVHSFETLTGSVASDGATEIQIDLTSVETTIDIRNERMLEHVFNAIPSARLTTEIDMAAMEGLEIGESMTTEVEAVLSFLGAELDLYTDMYIVRLSETRVMALTNDMVFLETDTAGIDAGIDTLQELASLDNIARAVPVTLRFVFDQDS